MVLSRCRAGIASDVTATSSPTQTEESRVNSRLGSGGTTKSRAVHHLGRPGPCPPRSSSWARPAMSVPARSSGARVARGARSRRAAGSRPSRGSSTAAAISSARADGKDSTSASSRSRCSTSTPRSVSACGEGVVLLLRAVHPRDAVEEQLVVVARGEPPQLGPGAVQHHRAQPAHLAGGAHGRGGLGNSVGGLRLDHGQRLAQAAVPAPPSPSRWIVCRTAAGGVAGAPDRRCPWTCST